MKLRSAFPELTLIFQVIPELLKQGQRCVVKEIERYGNNVFSYVLLDPSCGMGRDLVVADVVPFYEALRKRLPDVCIGFAGGFDGSNAAERIQKIASAIGSKDFCVDAEGKLFTGETLDEGKMQRYVTAAAQGFCLSARG